MALNRSAAPALRSGRRESGLFSTSVSLWTIRMPNRRRCPRWLKTPDDSLLGVVLSHPHLDHYGLAFRVPPSTRVLMGSAAERILEASAIFTPSGGTFENVTHLENGKTLPLGPFKITPYLMDHSAYDSYAMLWSKVTGNGFGENLSHTLDLPTVRRLFRLCANGAA